MRGIRIGGAGSLLLSLLLLLLLLGACSPEPARVGGETLDLIARYRTGALRAETGSFALHGEERAAHFRQGWSLPVPHPGGGAVAAIADSAELAFTVVRVEPKQLELTLSLRGPQPGPSTQRVTALLEGHRLAEWELTDAADLPVRLELPAELLVRGENRIVLRFAALAVHPDFAGAVVSNVTFPAVAAYVLDPRLAGAGGAGVEAAFQLSSVEGVLRQSAPSYAQHTFRLMQGARLEVAGTAADEVLIELRSESAPTWRRIAALRGAFSRGIELGVAEGEIGQVRLTVASGECAWSAIRLEGVVADPRREPSPPGGARMRHLVVLVLDALRSDMLAAGGDRGELTPNLDRLAERGVVFRTVTAASSFTPASVYAYFTGEAPTSPRLLPERMNVGTDDPIIRAAGFDLAAAFGAAGYRTVDITGNFYLKAEQGLTASFREEHYIWPEAAPGATTPRSSAMEQAPVLATIAEMAARPEPVFLYLHYLPPHLPYNPPEPHRGSLTGDRAPRVTAFPSRLSWLYEFGLAGADHVEARRVFDEYKENVRYADALAGEVVAALERHGLLDETLIVLLGDHGEAFNEHGKFKHGSTVYDEMIRVPLVFVHPALTPATVARHVGLIDLPPTLVELFGLACAGHRFEGRSLRPLLAGESEGWEDEWYFSMAAEGGLHFGYRSEKLKAIFSAGQDQLFDLAADPLERRSIADQAPLLTAWLRQKGNLRLLGAQPEMPADGALDGDGVPDGDGAPGGDGDLPRDLRDLGYIK